MSQIRSHWPPMLTGLRPLGGAALAVALLTGAGPHTAAADEPASGTQGLAQLRTEIDTLAQGVRRERESLQAERLRLEAQRGLLEQQIRQEQIRLASLRQVEQQQRARAQAQRAEAEAQVQPVQRALEQVRKSIERSLPFKQEERLGAVTELFRALQSGALAPPQVAERLWQLVEDERALTTEVGVHRQPVHYGDQRQLVEVLHVGMSLLYLRTAAGEIAWAVPQADGYRWEPITAPEITAAVQELFALNQGRGRGAARIPIPPALWDTVRQQGGAP